jgi:hypothetical protein
MTQEIVCGTITWDGGSVNLTNTSERVDAGVTIVEENPGSYEAQFQSTIEIRTKDSAIYGEILGAVGKPITLTLFGATAITGLYLRDKITYTRLGVWHIIGITLKPPDSDTESDPTLFTGLLSWDGGGEGKELTLENLSESTDDGIEILTNSTILLSGKKNIQGSDEYYFAPTIEMKTKDGTFWSTLLTRIGIDSGTKRPKVNTLTLFGVVWTNMVITGKLSRRREDDWHKITFQLEQQTA